MTAAASSTGSPIGEYIAIVLTASLAVGGYFFRQMVSTLKHLQADQSTQSASLSVLVERVAPMGRELDLHDTRLRSIENGQARLEGAMEAHRQWVQHAVLPPSRGE